MVLINSRVHCVAFPKARRRRRINNIDFISRENIRESEILYFKSERRETFKQIARLTSANFLGFLGTKDIDSTVVHI